MLLDPWHSVSRSSELYVKMQELTQASIQAEDILKASCNEKALNTYYSQTSYHRRLGHILEPLITQEDASAMLSTTG
jgi:hypothetical protein